jgi:hypothetical protein
VSSNTARCLHDEGEREREREREFRSTTTESTHSNPATTRVNINQTRGRSLYGSSAKERRGNTITRDRTPP